MTSTEVAVAGVGGILGFILVPRLASIVLAPLGGLVGLAIGFALAKSFE